MPGSRALFLDIEPHVWTLLRNGPPSAAVDLVFLSEAYLNHQAAVFYDDAARILRDHFGDRNGAFAGVRPLFNVHAIFIPSLTDRVATATEPLSSHNLTAFGCYREPKRLRSILPGLHTDARATNVCHAHLGCESCDFLVLVVNDLFYGGLAGGIVTIITNSRTTGAISARHELAHAFADIGEAP